MEVVNHIGPHGIVRDHDARRRAVGCLQAKGARFLGEGCYGTVVSDPEDATRVIKVGYYSRGETGGEPKDGWLDYVRACADHPSPHRPKVYRLDLFPDHYEARMELLQEAFDERTQDVSRSVRSSGAVRSPSRLPGPLGEFGRWIEERLSDHGFDCHAGNVMFRADGTPVITDPVT